MLEEQVGFVPTYGNTLMGLACHKPGFEQEDYSITYYAPQPRAVLRVTDPDDSRKLVDYGEWGRVELTTLTHEFFLPRFLERDAAKRMRAAARTSPGTAWRRCSPSAHERGEDRGGGLLSAGSQ